MMLDRTLAREIKALNGDGSRDVRFETMRLVGEAHNDLSSSNVRKTFNECLRKHGRATVAICIASTLYMRRERLDNWGMRWARMVLELWTNRGPSFVERAAIDDGLHPTRICEYAGEFIRLTTEE